MALTAFNRARRLAEERERNKPTPEQLAAEELRIREEEEAEADRIWLEEQTRLDAIEAENKRIADMEAELAELRALKETMESAEPEPAPPEGQQAIVLMEDIPEAEVFPIEEESPPDIVYTGDSVLTDAAKMAGTAKGKPKKV